MFYHYAIKPPLIVSEIRTHLEKVYKILETYKITLIYDILINDNNCFQSI